MSACTSAVTQLFTFTHSLPLTTGTTPESIDPVYSSIAELGILGIVVVVVVVVGVVVQVTS